MEATISFNRSASRGHPDRLGPRFVPNRSACIVTEARISRAPRPRGPLRVETTRPPVLPRAGAPVSDPARCPVYLKTRLPLCSRARRQGPRRPGFPIPADVRLKHPALEPMPFAIRHLPYFRFLAFPLSGCIPQSYSTAMCSDLIRPYPTLQIFVPPPACPNRQSTIGNRQSFGSDFGFCRPPCLFFIPDHT
jgi:hypothetical protein